MNFTVNSPDELKSAVEVPFTIDGKKYTIYLAPASRQKIARVQAEMNVKVIPCEPEWENSVYGNWNESNLGMTDDVSEAYAALGEALGLKD